MSMSVRFIVLCTVSITFDEASLIVLNKLEPFNRLPALPIQLELALFAAFGLFAALKGWF